MLHCSKILAGGGASPRSRSAYEDPRVRGQSSGFEFACKARSLLDGSILCEVHGAVDISEGRGWGVATTSTTAMTIATTAIVSIIRVSATM